MKYTKAELSYTQYIIPACLNKFIFMLYYNRISLDLSLQNVVIAL